MLCKIYGVLRTTLANHFTKDPSTREEVVKKEKKKRNESKVRTIDTSNISLYTGSKLHRIVHVPKRSCNSTRRLICLL